MSVLKICPSKIEGEVRAPPSKSYTHRAFAIALLAKGKSEVIDPLLALDTQATIDAVRVLGATVSQRDGTWEVDGTAGKLRPTSDTIDARNSGTTLRLMTAISSLSPSPVRLTGDESLLARPMGPLIQALSELGAGARCEGSKGKPPVVVGGGLEGGEVEIPGGVSSQFISALLIASPYSRKGVELRVTGELRSRPYIEITLELLGAVGARIKHGRDLMEFKIPGEQVFNSRDFEIPGDFSSAAFPLVAALITGGEVRVNNLNVHGAQGDKRLIDFLAEFGADVRVKGKTVELSGGETSGVDLDCGDTPDLVPALAVVGSLAEGWTRLTNVPHLRYKETDRLRALCVELGKMGAEINELPDGLKIRGVRELKGTRVNSHGDHRMAMALSIAGLAARGETVVDGAESIPVSYPSFIDDMRKLGAGIEIEH